MTPRRIARLPQAVADAIAAGEVIERPASVVKELFENAVDAGASIISVAVDGGGLVRIEVVDDGGGVAPEDLELAVARHATSKIRSAADLAAIASLGFRGEALASMAAVCELTIVTRTAGAAAGAMLRARDGVIIERGEAASPKGTRVLACELFATTPARLRFLRGERSESAAVKRLVAELAQVHTEVAVSLRIDGAEVLRTTGSGSTRTALLEVLGTSSAGALVDVAQAGAIDVSGAISPPHLHQGTRAGLVLVVNRRRVHNRALITAVEEAYRGLIPSGRHPFGVVRVDVDEQVVDVNVHPTKREVRFLDERAVFSAVQRACWAALRSGPMPVPAYEPVGPPAGMGGASIAAATLQLEDAPPAAAGGGGADLVALAPLTVLGQANAEWIVAAAPEAVVLIDPHAAHEKTLYVGLLHAWEAAAHVESQMLLLPAVVELRPAQLERFEESRDELAAAGFAVERFGPDLLRCTAVPAIADRADPARMISALLDALEGPGGDAVRRHRIAALIACHSAVRFGDALSLAEQQAIVDRLATTPGGATCPHGRPTAIVLGERSLRHAFHRPTG